MSKKDNTNKEFINKTADWLALGDRDLLVDKETGRFREDFVPTIRAVYEGLNRFITAPNKWNTYETALEEIKAGKKKTHWIWFIFPQMVGLGSSYNAEYFGIRGRDEAEAYLENPILRERLIEATEAVYNNEKSVYEIFGNDAVKVRSCMLLFASVSDIPIFKKMISKYCWK